MSSDGSKPWPAQIARQQALVEEAALYHRLESAAQTMAMCVRELETLAEEQSVLSKKLTGGTEEQAVLEGEIRNVRLLQRTVADLRHEVEDLNQRETEALIYKGTLEERLRSATTAWERSQTLQQQI